MDIFWRLDISNSFYLNKSYRIIGKLWLLNEKHEIVKQHLERNSDIENQENQNKISLLLLLIGSITTFGSLKGVYDLYTAFFPKEYAWSAILTIIGGFIAFIYWKFKKKSNE